VRSGNGNGHPRAVSLTDDLDEVDPAAGVGDDLPMLPSPPALRPAGLGSGRGAGGLGPKVGAPRSILGAANPPPSAPSDRDGGPYHAPRHHHNQDDGDDGEDDYGDEEDGGGEGDPTHPAREARTAPGQHRYRKDRENDDDDDDDDADNDGDDEPQEDERLSRLGARPLRLGTTPTPAARPPPPPYPAGASTAAGAAATSATTVGWTDGWEKEADW
jgi:hypothetical protein